MSKRFFHFFIVPALALLLASCAASPASPTTAPTAADMIAESTLPPQTQPPTETEATHPTDPQTETASLPYLQQIHRPDQSIYGGPSYDYGFVDTVRSQGTYTIVEEAQDPEGNLWGKLKSGIGWVDLTQIRQQTYPSPLISANYANADLLHSGAHHLYSGGQEYSVPVAFRAYGHLRDVTLFTLEFRPEGYFPGEDFFTLPDFTEQMPMVAELPFPGDMTMYGIRFTDETGTTHVCTIYISGRNGALELKAEP